MSESHIIDVLRPHMRDARFERLQNAAVARMRGLTVVLESLYDPGNQAAVFRSGDAHGLTDVHVINAQNATKTQARSVSRGTEKWLDIHTYDDAAPCVERLRAQGFQIAVSDLDAASPLHSVDFSTPTALVFGSERFGVSETMREAADVRFRIPMYGFVQSLNISVAAAITLHVARQGRERALGAETDLSVDEKHWLLAHWMRRSVTNADALLAEAGIDVAPLDPEQSWEDRLAAIQEGYTSDQPAIGISRTRMRGRNGTADER